MHNGEDINLEAEITLSYESPREAEAIAKAISPDNVKVPEGLTIKTIKRGSKVITLVKCQRNLESFIATIDDILMAVQVAERAISAGRVHA
jgi:tRNA threonylcarbamoyladenosine modification (KEOPS) complex  Pcc1 subunit